MDSQSDTGDDGHWGSSADLDIGYHGKQMELEINETVSDYTGDDDPKSGTAIHRAERIAYDKLIDEIFAPAPPCLTGKPETGCKAIHNQASPAHLPADPTRQDGKGWHGKRITPPSLHDGRGDSSRALCPGCYLCCFRDAIKLYICFPFLVLFFRCRK